MSRVIVFKCDSCKQEIGKKKHFSLTINGSSGVAVPAPDSDRWGMRGEIRGDIVHFCGPRCLNSYFSKIFKEANNDPKF